MAERMRYVLDEFHPALPPGPLKVNDLGDLSGVKGGPISRLANPALKKNARPETFKKIAETAGVSYVWLSLGEGEPGDPNTWVDSYDRELETALAYHTGEFSPATVARARELAHGGESHPARQWARRLRELQLEILQQAHAEDEEATRFTRQLGEALVAIQEGATDEAAAPQEPKSRPGQKARRTARVK